MRGAGSQPSVSAHPSRVWNDPVPATPLGESSPTLLSPGPQALLLSGCRRGAFPACRQQNPRSSPLPSCERDDIGPTHDVNSKDMNIL